MSSADVKIDSAIAQFGAHRYPIANILSYRTADTVKEGTTIWRVGAFSALLLVFVGWHIVGRHLFYGNERYAIYGVFLALVLLAGALPKRKAYTYMLYIGTPGSEQLAFCTHSDNEMKSIEQELRRAISKSGDGIEMGYETSKI
jgi:Family of unknown function (DUF6232)